MTTTGTANGMAARDWGFLACRVLALYLFYQAILIVLPAITFAFVVQSGGENAWFERYYYVFWFLLVLAAGLVLWFGAARLAERLAPAQAEEMQEATAGERDVTRLLSLAVAVFGLVVLILAIPDAAGLAARYLAPDRPYAPQPFEIAVVATRLVLGLVLIFGGRGIADLIGRARGWRAN